MTVKLNCYALMDKYGFVIIMKQTSRGWYWWTIVDRFTEPVFNGKSKPKIDRDENYILVNDYESIRPSLDWLMQYWKTEVLEDHRLLYTDYEYLDMIYHRNKARSIQYYISDERNAVITLETKYTKDRDGGDWTQVLGIVSRGNMHRTWYRQSDGEMMLYPGKSLRRVDQSEALEYASRILDEEIAEYLNKIKEFCEADE